MVKLDAGMLRYLSHEDFRVLTAIEMDEGYKLTFPGYDYLALRALVSRGTISGIGNQIGVGKESDVMVVSNAEGKLFVAKFHRLGRNSFRTVKNNRDYLRGRHASSWLYLSRLSATKEYAYLNALYSHGFPVPEPVDQSRHVVVMEYCNAEPLSHITSLSQDCSHLYNECMTLLVKLAQHGLIHGDFNEFNLLLERDTEKLIMIDFPQMISTTHRNSDMYFQRDVDGVSAYFRRVFRWTASEPAPTLQDVESTNNLDWEVQASGYVKTNSNNKHGAGEIDAEVFEMYKDMLQPLPLDGEEVEEMSGEDDENSEQENDDQDKEQQEHHDKQQQQDEEQDDSDDEEAEDTTQAQDGDGAPGQADDTTTPTQVNTRTSIPNVTRRVKIQMQRQKAKEKNQKMVKKSSKREKRSTRSDQVADLKSSY